MAVIDAAGDFNQLRDCWFPGVLDLALRQLTSQEVQNEIAWINTHIFDAALAEPTDRMNVTEAVRRFIPNAPDWTGSPLMPLYDRTGQDEVRAGRLYGNLVCRVRVNRPERWWCFPEPVAEDRFSRTYVLESRGGASPVKEQSSKQLVTSVARSLRGCRESHPHQRSRSACHRATN